MKKKYWHPIYCPYTGVGNKYNLNSVRLPGRYITDHNTELVEVVLINGEQSIGLANRFGWSIFAENKRVVKWRRLTKVEKQGWELANL